MKVALLLAALVPMSAAAQQGDVRIAGGTVHDGSGRAPQVKTTGSARLLVRKGTDTAL